MNRYEVVDIIGSNDVWIIDNITSNRWQVEQWVSDDICKELNKLSERADKVLESFTTEELLKLKWEKDINKRFADEVIKIMNKYEIKSLEKLDQVLFNQRVW